VSSELITPGSVLTGIEKLLVASFHLTHVKVKGPVPPGLTALRLPFCVPVGLQKIKTGSLTAGADGYEVYLMLLIPGAVSWANTVKGNSNAAINR
jgi:hypothetical protein